MRLLSVIPGMGIGGAETVVEMLGTHALGAGHDVCLASAGGFRADALHARGARTWPVPLQGRRPGDLARVAQSLRSCRRQLQPELVHAHNVKAAVAARAACGHRVPLLVTLHGLARHDYPAAARLLRVCSDRVVAVSDHVAEELRGCGFPPRRISVLENAVAPPASLDRAESRTRLGIPQQAPVVLCMARMTEQKRHDLLIRAWSGLRPDARLLLVGDGPRRQELESRVRNAGLAGRIRFLGPRVDVDRLLAVADMLVLPTDWEGLPVSVLEAMGARVPVVASRVGGLADALGDAAMLVDPGSADALAEALSGLLADRPARTRLADRGHRLVTTRYSTERMLTGYATLYADMAGDGA